MMRSVYIVDDDASIRRSTAFLVKSAGYQPRAFTSASDFLREAPMLLPGVLLLDVRMPEMDGFALLDDLPASLGALFPIVMITGHGDLATAVQAIRHGVRDFLESRMRTTTCSASWRASGTISTDICLTSNSGAQRCG